MIESVNNDKIKKYAKLKQKKYRMLEHKFIVEGEHLVEEAEKRGLTLEVFATYERENATLVSKNVMAKLSDLDSLPSVLAICKMPLEKAINGNVLILDDIQDPGNLGTIIRSAVAFGIDTIVASLNTVDLYNLKTIRSSEGMLFNINYLKKDLKEYIPLIKKTHKIYATNVATGKDIRKLQVDKPYALIVGNEGNGVRKEVQEMANETINIPICNECESLNVAIATSIILYEFAQK